MLKYILCSLFAAAVLLPHSAQANDRISRLERTVAELSARLARLEQQNRQQHIIIENRQSKPPVYSCSVSAFGRSYSASAENEGTARHQVRQACSAEQNAMFCGDREISCKRYP